MDDNEPSSGRLSFRAFCERHTEPAWELHTESLSEFPSEIIVGSFSLVLKRSNITSSSSSSLGAPTLAAANPKSAALKSVLSAEVADKRSAKPTGSAWRIVKIAHILRSMSP
eukprot:CAMPEP_0172829538 /NCGR_PEP_ID=MMETSP1075-20121228/21603_1 /TAXON_ID=2916 /ORGANISM="Ceratium fusus, Strain PA161109" /LENGTH=111 /DNA_ID=CAMNT_0013671691 /DNA_START=200 /DNA_END=535 /DNA_ORIENTATION=-